MKAELTVNKQARKVLAKGNLPCAVGVTTVLLCAVMLSLYAAYMLTDALGYVLPLLNCDLLQTSHFLYYTLLVVFTAGTLVLTLPLFMGAVRFFYLTAKNEEASFSEMFCYACKGKYFKSLGKSLRIAVAHTWQALVSFLPGVLILISANAGAENKTHLDFYNILWYSISYAMIIGGICLFLFLSADKFLSVYLLIENENLSAKDALRYSEYLMHGYEKSVHRIIILYLPFLVLCLAVIPLLFVIPYIMTSYGVSAKWIIQLLYKQNKDE